MGFFSGVATGVALAAGAAAWYLSRSGEQFRDRYRVDRKLGELGDQLETRTREIQQMISAQMSDSPGVSDSATAAADPGSDALDAAAASAAEAAAALAADVETKTVRVRKASKPAAD